MKSFVTRQPPLGQLNKRQMLATQKLNWNLGSWGSRVFSCRLLPREEVESSRPLISNLKEEASKLEDKLADLNRFESSRTLFY